MTRAEEAAAFAYVTDPHLAKDIHRFRSPGLHATS